MAGLSPEVHDQFNQLRQAVQKQQNAEVYTLGKKLLAALPPDTRLANFVTQITAGAALDIGNIDSALALTKPLANTHPTDWHAATLLARLYAESGHKELRDRQITHVLDLHKTNTDPDFAQLHVFPIQKVLLHSGYAVFLYPFTPIGRHNSYLIALIYTKEDKIDYRIELESDDVDQAFFKAKKPGERRFSIDSFRASEEKNNPFESQALHGFVDGVFDYDTMRDAMLKTANAEKPQNTSGKK